MSETTTDIGFEIRMEGPMDGAVETVTAALKEKGFGILTTIDLKEAFAHVVAPGVHANLFSKDFQKQVAGCKNLEAALAVETGPFSSFAGKVPAVGGGNRLLLINPPGLDGGFGTGTSL